MLCDNCNEESGPGAFFCGGCGRPLGFRRSAEENTTDLEGLVDVPPPESSRESGLTGAAGKKALCGRCMGAYLEDELATVDGQQLCGDCNTRTASRSMAHSQPVEEEAQFASPRTVRLPDQNGGGAPGSNRRVALVIALVVAVVGIAAAVALPGADRIDKLISKAKDTGEAINLAQTYVAGESFEYGVTMKAEMSMEGDGQIPMLTRRSGDMDMDMSGQVRIDVLSVEPGGNATVYMALSGFKMDVDVKVDDKKTESMSFDPLQGAGESSVTMTVDPYGKVIGEVEQDGPGLGGVVNLGQFFGQGLGGAPRGKLEVGDTWGAPATVCTGQAGGASMDVKAEYRVEGIMRYQGRSCIAISVEGSFSADALPGADVDGDLKGAMLIDARTRCLVKSAMDAGVEISISSSSGSGSVRMSISMDLDLQ